VAKIIGLALLTFSIETSFFLVNSIQFSIRGKQGRFGFLNAQRI
jgi:hypothetical protein